MSINSVYKLLDYLVKVAKEPVDVNGSSVHYDPPLSVTISESFFWKDNCIMCGRCCMNETVVWTDEGLNRIIRYIDTPPNAENSSDEGVLRISSEDLEDLSTILVPQVLTINGVERTFYVCPKDSRYDGQWHYFEGKGDRQRCHWMRELDGKFCCGIHPVRSVTCALPHMRFYHAKKTNRTFIRMMQYGRNHKLGCPIEFGEVSEEGMPDKIHWLKILKECADDLGISTWLPEIIQYLEEGNRNSVTFGKQYSRNGGLGRGLFGKSDIKKLKSGSKEISADVKQRFSSLLRRSDESSI